MIILGSANFGKRFLKFVSFKLGGKKFVNPGLYTLIIEFACNMKKIMLLVQLILMRLIIVLAQVDDTNEGRITEHTVFSVVAVLGIIAITHFVRKKRIKESVYD